MGCPRFDSRGTDSAFTDLLVPGIVRASIFHVPSFAITLLLAGIYPSLPDRAAAVLRVILIAAAVLGLALLVDLDRLYLSLTTDMQASAIRFHKNYAGLCILTDASIAWLWLTTINRPTLNWSATLLLASLPATIYVALFLTISGRAQEDFLRGLPGEPLTKQYRGDQNVWAFTRQPLGIQGHREAALEFVKPFGPENNRNYQDLAVYFTNSLHDAREFGVERKPLETLCLYEDGTPTTWHIGLGDCFSEHENFAERLDRMYSKLPDSLPRDVQTYRIAAEICADVTVPDDYRGEIEEINFCRYARLEQKRAELVRVHGEAALEVLLTVE